jgi:heavy metal efflux system protein
MNFSQRITVLACIVVLPLATQAQTTPITLEQAVQQSLQQNQYVQAARYDVEARQTLTRTASDIGKLSVTGMVGQYNSYVKSDNNITISQSIPFPTVFGARASLGHAQATGSALKLAATEDELVWQVKATWYQLAYLHARHTWYVRQDSLYKKLADAANVRQRTGEANLLEKATAESRYGQSQTALRQNEADLAIYRERLQILLNSSAPVDVPLAALAPRTSPMADTAAMRNNPQLQWYRQQVVVAEKERAVERSELAPDLLVGYFNQTLIGTPTGENTTALATRSDRFQGFMVGVSVPLWYRPQAARAKAAEYTRQAAESRYTQEQRNYAGELAALSQEVATLRDALKYYTGGALPHAELILKQANLAFRSGDISYVELVQSLQTAADVQHGYLGTLNQYNQAVVKLEYLLAID